MSTITNIKIDILAKIGIFSNIQMSPIIWKPIFHYLTYFSVFNRMLVTGLFFTVNLATKCQLK